MNEAIFRPTEGPLDTKGVLNVMRRLAVSMALLGSSTIPGIGCATTDGAENKGATEESGTTGSAEESGTTGPEEGGFVPASSGDDFVQCDPCENEEAPTACPDGEKCIPDGIYGSKCIGTANEQAAKKPGEVCDPSNPSDPCDLLHFCNDFTCIPTCSN